MLEFYFNLFSKKIFCDPSYNNSSISSTDYAINYIKESLSKNRISFDEKFFSEMNKSFFDIEKGKWIIIITTKYQKYQNSIKLSKIFNQKFLDFLSLNSDIKLTMIDIGFPEAIRLIGNFIPKSFPVVIILNRSFVIGEIYSFDNFIENISLLFSPIEKKIIENNNLLKDDFNYLPKSFLKSMLTDLDKKEIKKFTTYAIEKSLEILPDEIIISNNDEIILNNDTKEKFPIFLPREGRKVLIAKPEILTYAVFCGIIYRILPSSKNKKLKINLANPKKLIEFDSIKGNYDQKLSELSIEPGNCLFITYEIYGN